MVVNRIAMEKQLRFLFAMFLLVHSSSRLGEFGHHSLSKESRKNVDVKIANNTHDLFGSLE
jgi:hypothetical protein